MGACQNGEDGLGWGMKMVLEIPDEISAELTRKLENPSRSVLEALAAVAYEQDVLSEEQVRRLLNLSSCWEARDVLKRHGVWPGATVEDVMSDMDMLKSLRAPAP